MAHRIEGNDTAGYRVIDDDLGPLTARVATAAEAKALVTAQSPRKAQKREVKPEATEPASIAVTKAGLAPKNK